MASIETVSMGDVLPFELNGVKMNPRDTKAKDIDAYIDDLAAQFKVNRARPGQPRFRPILWRDGGIYQIIDGECRYMAMKKIGTKSFEAEVYDDLDEAEAAREAAQAMLDTDLKRPLTAEEKAAAIQTQIAYELDEETIAASARIDKKRVPRIKRGLARAGDVIDQMTLDWAEAVGEAEDAGDAEMVEALTAASASTWRSAISQVRAKRDAEERKAAILEALAWAGIAVADGNADMSGLRYVSSVSTADDVKRREWPEGSVAYMQWDTYGYVYAPEPEADPAEERAKAERDAAHRQWEEACESRDKWLAENLAEIEPGHLVGLLPNGSELPVYADDVIGFAEAYEADIPIGPEVTIAAYCALTESEPWPEGLRSPDPEACRLFVALTDALELKGYEPPEAEQRLYQMAVDAIGKEDGDE